MSILDLVTRATSMSLLVSLAACGGPSFQPQAAGGSAQDLEEGAPEPVITVAEVGFHAPESVLHDPEADVYLVSNLGGSPFGEDKAGFISRVRPDGTLESLKWIDGSAAQVTLNAPKGMAIVGDLLYVADVKVVRMFERTTGAPAGEIRIPEASFLEDMAVSPDQVLYVSDTGLGPHFKPTGTDAIYRIDGNRAVSVLIKDPALAQPKGLVATGDAVFAVDWAKGMLRRIGLDGSMTVLATLPVNQLDGLVRDATGAFLVSSWAGLAVYRVTGDGQVSTAIPDLQAPAGIGYDRARNRLLIPLGHDDKVELHAL
jgi:hypothetical protein